MFYFRLFPKINHQIDSTNIELIDLTTRSKVLSYIYEEIRKENYQGAIRLYLNDPIKKPEEISNEMYSSYDYTWTILILNHVYDINRDWAVSQEVLDKRIKRKYETLEKAQQTFIEFYDEYGYEVDAGNPNVHQRVSAFEKYVHENELKKDVKIFDPSIISRIQSDFERDLG